MIVKINREVLKFKLNAKLFFSKVILAVGSITFCVEVVKLVCKSFKLEYGWEIASTSRVLTSFTAFVHSKSEIIRIRKESVMGSVYLISAE